ncbi:MAG: tRNA1(Val) (adenine(37)-N6)-methyltransferase [Clostridia bacterium]
MKIELKENEEINDLEYKGLKMIQNKEGFCFGMDSILLSDFAKEIKDESYVIDLGAGTGILDVLLCGKTNLKKIIGVEIQEDVANLAKRNIQLNHLEDKFEMICSNIKDIIIKNYVKKNSFDVVVTNPPYKKDKTGIQNKNYTKLIARHEIEANLEDFIQISYQILKDKGTLYMIHRPERLVDILILLRNYKIEPKEIRFVQPKAEKDPNLVLVKGIKNAKAFIKVQKPLIVYQNDGNYTEEILKIYHKEEKKK